MSGRTSSVFSCPTAGAATLDLAYDGSAIPQIRFDNEAVTIQARPAVETSISGLKFFVAEARYWNGIVESRLPYFRRERARMRIVTDVDFAAVGGDGERIDGVSITASIAAIPDGELPIEVTWARANGGVTLAARPTATMLWADWLDFLSIHEQFISLVETGHR